MNRLRLARFLVGLTLLPGCAGQRADVYLDPAFEAESLAAAPITWLGVTALAGPDDDTARLGSRDRAFAAAQEQRPDLRWVQPELAWIGLGPQQAHELLDTYRLSGRYTADQLDRLGVISDRARYVFVGRVDLDLTSLDYDRQEREANDRWMLIVEPRARREMSATFDLFDLRARTLVFSVQLHRTETERGNPLEVEMFESTPSEADYERAVRELLARETMPEAPSRAQVLSNLAREAVRALPGTSRGR